MHLLSTMGIPNLSIGWLAWKKSLCAFWPTSALQIAHSGIYQLSQTTKTHPNHYFHAKPPSDTSSGYSNSPKDLFDANPSRHTFKIYSIGQLLRATLLLGQRIEPCLEQSYCKVLWPQPFSSILLSLVVFLLSFLNKQISIVVFREQQILNLQNL